MESSAIDRINLPLPHRNVRLSSGPAGDSSDRAVSDQTELSGSSSSVDSDRYICHMREKAQHRVAPLDTDSLIGLGVGSVGAVGSELSGVGTYIHEGAHKLAVEKLYDGSHISVQIDAFDNIKKFIETPSLENLGNIMSANDVGKDGAAGVTTYDYGKGPSALGEKLSPNGRQAVISAAGSISTLIPDLAGFAVGMKLRKKHPVLGYSLMSLAGVHHFANSMYPLSAALSGPKSAGHDWAKFAQATGIPAVLTGVIFAVSLPALGAVMYFSEKHREEKARNHQALASLIARGRISTGEVEQRMEKFPGKKDIVLLEEKIDKKLEDGTRENIDPSEMKKLTHKLSRSYCEFGESLIEEYKELVEEEKKRLPETSGEAVMSIMAESLKSLKESFKTDPLGASLDSAGIAGGITVAGKAAYDAVQAVVPTLPSLAEGIAGRVLSTMVPGLGLLFTANAVYKATQAFKNPEVSGIDKVAAGSMALFTGVSAAGSAIPALGFPMTIAGLIGMGGTQLGQWIAHKIAD
ncbi:MAG: hypothetical protein AB9903_17220 [Vulcanimicrobiota bacterium]